MQKLKSLFNSSNNQTGSKLLWSGFWVAGIAALGYFSVAQHVPALELATKTELDKAISSASSSNITTKIDGYTAILSGDAQNEANKQNILVLAAATPGVKTVVDNMTPADMVTAELAAAAPLMPTATNEQTRDPSLTLDVYDGTLMLGGEVAITDSLNQLIRQAKNELKVDFVSNSAQARADTKNATWLQPITALLPALAALENPGISVEGSEITLRGKAPNQEARDELIARSLQLVGDFSLIERIVVEKPKPEANQKIKDTGKSKITNPIKEVAKKILDKAPKPEIKKAPEEEKPKSADTPVDNTAVSKAFDALPSKRVLFKSNRAILTRDSKTVLENIARLLETFPEAKMSIAGHTDATGRAEDNLMLSQERANSVRDYLVSQGISPFRLRAFGYGESLPIADNNDEKGRSKNRRIEFRF